MDIQNKKFINKVSKEKLMKLKDKDRKQYERVLSNYFNTFKYDSFLFCFDCNENKRYRQQYSKDNKEVCIECMDQRSRLRYENMRKEKKSPEELEKQRKDIYEKNKDEYNKAKRVNYDDIVKARPIEYKKIKERNFLSN